MPIINLDSEFAKEIGFTSDRFAGWLWRDESRIIISCIDSLQPNQGNFSLLIKTIHEAGFDVAVPTPLSKMQAILTRKGFTPKHEQDPAMGDVEVWTLPCSTRT